MLRNIIGGILAIIIVCCPSITSGQNAKIDSLKRELRKEGSPTVQTAKLYDDLAWEYLFINPDAAIPYADSSLLVAQKTGDAEKKAVALHTIGVIFLVKQNYDSALVYFEKSVAITEPLDLYLKAGAAYSNIGISHYELGNYDTALVYQNKALDYRTLGKDTLEMAKSVINIGAIWQAKGNYVQAIESCLLAIDYLEKSGSNEELIATCENNIGSMYLQMGNFEKSLDYLRRAETVFEKNENTYRLPMLYNNFGEAYNNLGQYEDAIAYLLKALEMNNFDERTLSYTYFGLGHAFNEKKEHDTALKYLFKALELDKKNGNLKEMASAYAGIGETYYAQQAYAQASRYLAEGEAIADSINALPELVDFKRLSVANQLEMRGLSSISEQFGAYRKLQDSLFSIEKTNKIEELETQYRTRMIQDSLQYAKERNQLVEADFRKEKAISRLLKVLMLILIGIIGLFWYLFRLKRQQNQQLESSNQTLLTLNKELTEELQEKESELLSPEVVSNKTLTLTSNGKEVVRLGDILYIQSQDKAVQVYTPAKTHWDWVTLKTYSEILPPQIFLKIHRSYIINVLHIQSRTRRVITMSNGVKINIGNTIREEVNAFLDKREIN